MTKFAGLVTFTEKILNGKHLFFLAVAVTFEGIVVKNNIFLILALVLQDVNVANGSKRLIMAGKNIIFI